MSINDIITAWFRGEDTISHARSTHREEVIGLFEAGEDVNIIVDDIFFGEDVPDSDGAVVIGVNVFVDSRKEFTAHIHMVFEDFYGDILMASA